MDEDAGNKQEKVGDTRTGEGQRRAQDEAGRGGGDAAVREGEGSGSEGPEGILHKQYGKRAEVVRV